MAIRLWTKFILALVLVVVAGGLSYQAQAPTPVEATHFRSTQLTWTLVSGRTVKFRATIGVRRSYFGSPAVGSTISPTSVQFGDGGSATPALTVVNVDATNDWVLVDGTFTHTYVSTNSNSFTAFATSCCRLSGPKHINNPDADNRAETVVNFATSASPVSAISPIVDCPKNATCSFTVPATVLSGQTPSFRMATGPEATGGTFVQPGPPKATNAAAINPTSGIYTWNTTGATLNTSGGDTYYSTQVMVSSNANGAEVSRTAVDFFIRLSDQAVANDPPAFTAPTPNDGTVLTTTISSPALSFTVAATDPNLNDTVTLAILGMPTDATFMTSTTSSKNQAIGTFSWKPTTVGSALLTLTAQDQLGLGATQRSVTIRVVDDSTPTPTITATPIPPTVTATSTNTSTPTNTAIPTNTATPSSTITPQPSPTNTSTPTSTSTPTPFPAPIVIQIQPVGGLDNSLTNVLISGGNFRTGATVMLRLGAATYALSNVTVSSATTILAVVPALIPAGTYDVVVTNPGGQSGQLPAGYTVSGTAPSPLVLTPPQGITDQVNDVTIDGFNFRPGISAQLVMSGAVETLTNISRTNSTRVLAQVPAGILPGTYDLVMTNPGVTTTGILTQAYTAISPENDDFWIDAGDIWTSRGTDQSPTVRQGDANDLLGVNIHRHGGKRSATVLVTFYLTSTDTTKGGVMLGQVTSDPIVPMPTGREEVTPAFITWNVGNLLGTVTIYATIQPNLTTSEQSTVNNTAYRILTIQPPAPDTTPPDFTAFSANGIIGTSATISVPLVSLAVSALDPNADGKATGLQKMYFSEREYNLSARAWVPISNTGWLSFTPSYNYTLVNRGGMRFIQGWLTDGAGNISSNQQRAQVSYIPPSESLKINQVRPYRVSLTAGESLNVRLVPVTGDADFYVWDSTPNAAGSVGNSVLVRNNTGSTIDEGCFKAATTGTFQVEVFAYADTNYQLNLTKVATCPPQLRQESVAAQDGSETKTTPTQPFVNPLSAPPAGAVPASAPLTVGAQATTTPVASVSPTVAPSVSPTSTGGKFSAFLPVVARSKSLGW